MTTVVSHVWLLLPKRLSHPRESLTVWHAQTCLQLRVSQLDQSGPFVLDRHSHWCCISWKCVVSLLSDPRLASAHEWELSLRLKLLSAFLTRRTPLVLPDEIPLTSVKANLCSFSKSKSWQLLTNWCARIIVPGRKPMSGNSVFFPIEFQWSGTVHSDLQNKLQGLSSKLCGWDWEYVRDYNLAQLCHQPSPKSKKYKLINLNK